jgi:hypothetical protein
MMVFGFGLILAVFTRSLPEGPALVFDHRKAGEAVIDRIRTDISVAFVATSQMNIRITLRVGSARRNIVSMVS